jgi:hypothetical protein
MRWFLVPSAMNFFCHPSGVSRLYSVYFPTASALGYVLPSLQDS